METLQWIKPGHLRCIDQTKLPLKKEYIDCTSKEEVFHAIKRLSVRGAPAIGIAGAYGLCVELFRSKETDEISSLKKLVNETAEYLKTSRPTAVNLFWALDRMTLKAEKFNGNNRESFKIHMLNEAKTIHEEDRNMCKQIGKAGSSFIKDGMNILTHCNAGSLATGGSGTALAVLYQAHEEKKRFHVYADETRPLLQGARLTAFELMEAGINTTLICDSVAGFLMKQGKIDIIITGADRIAKNGDTANKIGTFSLAKLASTFKIPFYIAAPSSTFDTNTPTGNDIPIEERSFEEITNGFGSQTAPSGVKVYNPAFDVTDAALIHGFFTEKGLILPPYEESIQKVLHFEHKSQVFS